MLILITLFITIGLSLILKGYMENIFIIISAIIFYRQIIIYKEYKNLPYAFLISFIVLNSFIFFIKESVNIKEVQPIGEKEETLVLLVSEGEDRNYNIRERTTQIYYENGYKSFITGISDLYKYKSYYTDLGDSDFKRKTKEIEEKLKLHLGEGYEVVNTYMYSKPYFEKSIENIVESRYKKIIVCPLFMTEGKDYKIFKERYEKLTLVHHDLFNVEILEPLYKSNNLAMVYKNEVIRKINEIDDDAGVLLIGFEDKNNLEQDILFREKIKTYIEYEDKDDRIQIKMPLLENNKDDIIKDGEELLEYGINTLYVVFPTCAIDSIYTRYLVDSILKNLDMGNTKFYYIDPEKKIDSIVDELFTRISLMNT
ncbi:CbiX/SirB N-terminal domain-containing protein [Romboutsia sp. 1001216sp1]|uniref:CbiX/SirB N-terminal domain-containing protein n=1 Tax=Romboutsia TaxID=1501226 RepID=UPI000AA55347|nr:MULTISPECIES: CbiX/SirB N-terminal domain-containing protein [Romboutsia]MDB8789418.1 CbiX/SirB N-terminal domain-containing protein [Romboutsia sp. 1001216sp1]MDB8792801.1 CbiX/SirB N-terminal domain-containing protein [Romboutsia sp. 1001216sp1]MDB8795397.1 CbiX/SirB N-terminal domain-containing protein [Romboutsia sp. 1001216sp1]MDB8799207.1 CbiX/SirB N-terminal domain-containing protein [Romboutsia sp. 1001216sp1]MDB8802008.1 CbiX/SirB N-terminal domain-containing protein [Romboutsia sp